MSDLVVALLLGAAVLTAWLGTAALLLLGDKFDRLHTIGFVTVVPGLLVTLAVVVHEPLTALALKQAALCLAAVVIGGVLTHSLARAFRIRDDSTDRP